VAACGARAATGVFRMIELAFLLFSSAVSLLFFVGSLILLNLGRRLGTHRLTREGVAAMTGLNAVEGAVFALVGLLLAFTISGALQRFDERKQLILQEANAISSAYDRLDLLENEARLKLKEKLKEYVQARINLYRMPIEFVLWTGSEITSAEQQAKIFKLKAEIWDGAVAACPPASSRAACPLILPSLNSVFEIARLRNGANERHPPQIIYVMLFGLGLGGSLLAGFGMAAARTQSWVHMVTFAATLAVALFVITDIEFPRLGLIRVDYFDHFLNEVYERM
jgi:hypothetical protein